MKKPNPYRLLPAILLLALSAWAAETPETILIRSTLSNDLSGHRRSDADLVLSAYHEDFAAYDGHGNADPRAWTILYESRDAFSRALAEQLQSSRYETERTLPFIHVRGKQAMVTSIDSGRVVDRRTGGVTQIRTRRFWTLHKVEEEWLITGLIEELGDEALPLTGGGNKVDAIVQLLQREKEGWEDGSPGSISELFDEDFIGYDGYGTIKPETWKIIFNGSEELEKFLEKRFSYTSYTLDREVIFTTPGSASREAIALTREKVTTTPKRGDVVHSTERYVLWTLSHRSGDWKITNMCYAIGVPD